MIATAVLILRLALAVALYAFLGWALWMLLQEIRHQGERLAVQTMPEIFLSISTDNRQEYVRHFYQPELMIGRDPNAELAVMDEAMSAHHARLSYHHGQWWLEDLNSTNGTFLNRERLTTSAVVIAGDTFRCGNTVFNIRLENRNGPAPAEVLQLGGQS